MSAKNNHNRARKAETTPWNTGPARRPTTRASSSAAGYRSVHNYSADLDPTATWSPSPTRSKPGSRPAVRRSSIAHTTPPSRIVTRSKALNPLNRPTSVFGGWELPTPLARVARAATALKTGLACLARKQRRQALFSTRATRKGSHSPKLNFTNQKGCK